MEDDAMKGFISFIIVAVIALTISLSYAEGTFTFNFQGRMTNASGEPVPNGNYQIMLSAYTDSVGGRLLWNENHPSVEVNEGYFNIEAGILIPCSLSVAALDDVYIAAQINTEPPMERRFRILSTPNAGVARRLDGDLETLPGLCKLRGPEGSEKSIMLNTGSESMGIVIEERPADPIYGSRFFSGIENGALGMRFEGPSGRRFFEAAGMPGPSGSFSWKMFNPQPEPPGSDPLKLIELSSGFDGLGSLVMFNPQPEPPGSDPLRLIELTNGGVGGDAGIYMFNPQPEPPGSDPFFTLKARTNGPDLSMFAPQTGGARLANDHPQIRLTSNVTSSQMLLQRAFTAPTGGDDSIGVLIYADSLKNDMKFMKGGETGLEISTDAAGTSMSFFDDGSRYLGVDPSPWHSGGDLTMMGPTGGINMLLASNGMASIGTGEHTNILTIVRGSATDPIADAWTTYSSRRWKTNIQPLTGSLDKVMKLQGVSYDQKEGGKHDIGLIAEDVGQIVPEVVAYEDNGVDAKSIDYARLTALLVEAVKEQQKTIETYKMDSDKLNSTVSDLERRIAELERK